MNNRIKAFAAFLKGKKIAMLGIGVSNTPLAGIFARYGADVTVCDRRGRADVGEAAFEIENSGAGLNLGENYLSGLENYDIVFRTPGMKWTLPELQRAKAAGVSVTSEMEVFFELCPCPVIGITGSDGKTTTSSIIAEMLKRQGRRVYLGGNIGRALLPLAGEMEPDDVAVVELSSFQLISMRKSPDIAVVTNISPNHLDMHKDMAEYIDAKKNIIAHQSAFGRAILNLDNEITKGFIPETRGQCLTFSRRSRVALGSFLDSNGSLCFTGRNGKTEKILSMSEIKIPGMHNVENYLAAISALHGMVDPECMRRTAVEFGGVEHRIEFVRELDGVRYYNDSIATTPTRTMAGLDSFDQKVILIAGGYDKNIPFEVMGPKVAEKVKLLILLGQTAQKIEAAVKTAPNYDRNMKILHVDSLEAAVTAAHAGSCRGDIVTLSPACASFGMFKNFETRGEIYKRLVDGLE